MSRKPAPTPYYIDSVEADDKLRYATLKSADGATIFRFTETISCPFSQTAATAKFIEKACNSHEALIALVKKCIKLEKVRRHKLAKGSAAYIFSDERIGDMEQALSEALQSDIGEEVQAG